MNTHADKTQENKSQSVSNETSQKQGGGESTFQFVDNRPEAIVQRKLQEMANNSSHVSQLRAFQEMPNNSTQAQKTAQLQSMADNHSTQQQQPIQKKENNTGLPDNLKTGMENLSGMSLDDVKVHRNSDKPAQLQAHAYAQGTDIHLGPGQGKHLPHEAWHVVQQKQGRVKPTMQMKGKVNVNDDAGLEKEADVMGRKALNFAENHNIHPTKIKNSSKDIVQNQKSIVQRKQVGANEGNFGITVDKEEPIQLLTIRKFNLKDSSLLSHFFGEQGTFETDTLNALQLEQLIILLKEDNLYKKKTADINTLEEKLATLRPVSATDSDNSVVAALASRYEAVPWGVGTKPELQFVPKEELVTTAYYDPDSHVIKAKKDEEDEAALWDNILFEAQNARNQELFITAGSGSGGGSSKTLTEYGDDYATVEYDSFKKYVIELRQILNTGVKKEDLPSQAQKALTKADVYDQLSTDEERRVAFVNAPHQVDGVGKARLSTTDLYAYEAVEGFDQNTMSSRISTVVRSIYREIIPTNDFSQEPVRSVRAIYQSASWPLEGKKGNRPNTFDGIIMNTVTKARDLKSVHVAKVDLLEQLAVKLESLRLSAAARQIAVSSNSE